MDTIVATGVSAATVATILQLVKNSPLCPWISRESGRLNALLSVIAAGLTALGLSYDFQFDQETGGFTLGFTGTIGGLIDGGAHWIGQWTAQHAFYKGFIVPAESMGEIRAILKAGLLNQPPQRKPQDPPVPTLD